MEEFDIGDFELDEEIEIEDFELDVIKIEPIYEELIITPTTEEQVKEGSFNKVTVNAIDTSEFDAKIEELENEIEDLYGEFAENTVNGETVIIEDGVKGSKVSVTINGNTKQEQAEFPSEIIEINDVSLKQTCLETVEAKLTPIDLQGNSIAEVGNIKDLLKIDVNGSVSIEKNISKKVFNGSEKWTYYQGIVFIDIEDILSLGNVTNLNFYTNYFKAEVFKCYIAHTTGKRLHINLNNVGLSDITTNAEWKNWLATHNLEFLYQTDNIETVELPNIEPIELLEETNIFELIVNLSTTLSVTYKTPIPKDEDLIPDNIKKGVKIFDVEGAFDGIDTSDGTVEAKDIIEGKVAYARGEKIVGTLEGGFNAKIDTTGGTSLTPSSLAKNFITEINSLDASSFTELNSAFYEMKKLKKLPKYMDTSNIRNLIYAFYNCPVLENVPLLECGKVSDVNRVISMCNSIIEAGGFKDLGKAYTQKQSNYTRHTLDLQTLTLLPHESLMNIINYLYDLNLTYDVANGGTLYTQQLILGSTNKAKLTPEEIAIATKKGWTVS